METAVLVDSVEVFRLEANQKLDPGRRVAFGQFMTPPATAGLMASMFQANTDHLKLLDAGAGVGSLTAAFVSAVCSRPKKPKTIHVTAYEIDGVLAGYLAETLEHCYRSCKLSGVSLQFDLLQKDFVDDGVHLVAAELFGEAQRFNCAILNPPYKKIGSGSDERLRLRRVGIEASNLYTGFLGVAMKLLVPGGELVAITPRSFCNGPYFKPFRKTLLNSLTIRRMHVFESRQVAFKGDGVLQENVIFHGEKRSDTNSDGAGERPAVTISSSNGPSDRSVVARAVEYDHFVRPGDAECFIHIVPDRLGASIAQRFLKLNSTLSDLDLEVSTGRVVDFRATKFLRKLPSSETVPLIYPRNFENGFIIWPKPGGKKSPAIVARSGADELLVPRGTYVLVKRFSAKEESRRVVAAIYDPKRIVARQVGFENHTNFYHTDGQGLPTALAKGLSVFLNSTLVDLYFRQFSGHTQVNATDLRNLRYPSRLQLENLGSRIGRVFPSQDELDLLLEKILALPTPTVATEPTDTQSKHRRRRQKTRSSQVLGRLVVSEALHGELLLEMPKNRL